jgi:hypothetical protein
VRAFPLTVLNGGINRLRVKGGASASQLYDLQNGFISNAGSIVPREGTIRTVTLDSSTVGLAAADGVFNIFSSAYSTAALPANYVLNVLSDPNDRSQPPATIWFAKPFMGFEYVVAQFANGDIFHYWLQNNGVWTSNTAYTTASIVLPPTANGLAYQGVRDFPTNPTWEPDTATSLGDIVEPTTPTGFAYEAVSVAGGPSGMLLHFEGPNGSTSFVDAYGTGLFGTAHGTAAVTTGSAEFGTGSLILDGSTAYVTVPAANGGPIDIGSGDFTVEFWFKPTSLTGTTTLFSMCETGTATIDVAISVGGAGAGTVSGNVGGTSGGYGTSTLTTASFNHFALSVQGSNCFLYVNGAALGGGHSNFVAGGTRAFTAAQAVIGAVDTSGGPSLFSTGSLDELRITKGTALYTSAPFTPPAAAFSNTGTIPTRTGSVEPVWPTVAGGTLQEFGDFDTSVSDAGTTQSSGFFSTASALGSNITDRYGNSATIANSGIFSTSSTSGLTSVSASTKVTTWAPGTNYAPGAVVVPTTNQGAFINAIPNGDFEGGSAAGGWTFTDPGGVTQWAYSSVLPYQGSECLTFPGGTGVGAGGGFATMTSYSLVSPGQSVTASVYLNPNNAGANLTQWIQLNWYDSTDAIISSSGHAQNEQEGGGYRKTSITANAPANAAHVRVSIGAGSGTTSRNAGFADLVTWNLETPSTVTNFLFEAIQPVAGSSAATEPTWPTTINALVVDGGVTWQAVGTSIITWQAIPLMQSGATAPVFPTTIGNSVLDPSTFTGVNGVAINTTMSWVAIDRHISDPKCPNTLPVTIGASHVFAGDNDIADYSAAVNPTDWSSTNNAGYLPTGLNNYGDNPIAVLALYRSNLVVFNAGGYQMWQIDPDPQNMALLDAQPIGSTYTRAAQSVANDLIFLTVVGVRNLGTVGATANMAIGNTGQPVDPLVTAYLSTSSYTPLSLYYPGRGQYWLIFGTQAFVLTINGTGNRTWSRYSFPQAITDWTLNAEILYLRTANNLVWQFSPSAVGIDDSSSALTTQGANVPFNGVVQWPYLDLASLGINKMLVGVDIVGEGNCSIQIAYNQNDKSTFNDNPNFAISTSITAPYFVQIDDTVPGEPLAIPVNAPSYSPVLTFTGSSTSANAWTWQAMNIYFAPTPLNVGGATG